MRWTPGVVNGVSSSAPTAPLRTAAGGRLEVLEARLSCVEEEHRSEVATLRHALEECVLAIGSCAHAIDGICAEGATTMGTPIGAAAPAGPVSNALGLSSFARDLPNAAATLHRAASLGVQALGSTAGQRPPGPPYSPARAPSAGHQMRGRAAPHTAVWSSTTPLAEGVPSRRARSGSPGLLGAGHRRLLGPCVNGVAGDLHSCGGVAQPMQPALGLAPRLAQEDSPSQGARALSSGAQYRALSAGACGCKAGPMPVPCFAPVGLQSPPVVPLGSGCPPTAVPPGPGLLQPPGMLGALGPPPPLANNPFPLCGSGCGAPPCLFGPPIPPGQPAAM